MLRRNVVTCFLQHQGRILVLKRSDKVRTHKGKWAGVSGAIEAPTPLAQALREIREETGLAREDVRLLAEGRPLEVRDHESGVEWLVHPFLFEVRDPSSIRLDWEHTKFRWMDPAELLKLETVPQLKETWDQLWKT